MNAISDFLALKQNLSKNKGLNVLSKSSETSSSDDFHIDRNAIEAEADVCMKGFQKLHINSNSKLDCMDKQYNTDLSSLESKMVVSHRSNEPPETTKSQNSTYENDIKFQNWVEDVVQKESETDKYLEELKKEHGMTNYNLTDNTKLVSSLSWTDEDKLPNISDIDLDRLFMDGNNQFNSLDSAQKIVKGRGKPKNNSQVKNIQKLTPTNNKCKQKNTSKPKSVSQDYDQSPCDKEIDSWMSESIKKPIIFKNTKRSKSSYLDILSNLEEIDTNVPDLKNELPQHDIDGRLSQSESIEDIVSILEVLENENKKSRKYP